MEAFPTATWKPLQDKLRNIYALHKAAAGSLTCGGQKNDLISGIAFYNWCVKVTDLGKYECNARLNQTKSLKQFTASTLPALHQVNEISKLTTSKTIKSSKKQAKKNKFSTPKNAKKLALHSLVNNAICLSISPWHMKLNSVWKQIAESLGRLTNVRSN